MRDDASRRTRRQILRDGALLTGALAFPGAFAACGGDDEPTKGAAGSSGGAKKASGKVVYADGGGTTREARRKAFLDPFQKQSGIEVISADNDSAKFKLMAQRGKSQWDINDYDGYALIADTKEGLIQKLPDSVERNDLVPEQYWPWVTAAYTQSIVAFYPEGSFNGAGPESWADFWDVKKFPGKRAFPGIFYGTVEAALLADGVTPDKLFPLDFDRGFAKLDELRPHMTLFESYGEGQQMVASGSTPLGVSFNGRVFALTQQGSKMTTVWNQSIFYPWSPQAIPRGAPNPDATFELLDFMAKPEGQAEFAKMTGYGPTNSKALDLLDDAVKSQLPNAPDHVDSVATVDQEALSTQVDEYIKRFGEWLAKA
jgi:putative spermidine/putrescine transport system substrate-binding protein